MAVIFRLFSFSRLTIALLTFAVLGSLFNINNALALNTNSADRVHLRGVVVPSQQVKMSLTQNGLVTWIAPSGTTVSQGDKLAQINDVKLRAEMNQARAMMYSAQTELASAKHSYEKNRRLVQENILSDIALTESEFAVKTAEAKLEVNQSKLKLAKLAVDQASLLAPFNGVVAASNISPGEWAKAGDPIVEFASLSDLTMSIDIPPELTDSLSEGYVTNVNFNGTVIGKAKVKRLFPILQPSSGLRRVVWSVETDKSILISGRYVELEAWF